MTEHDLASATVVDLGRQIRTKKLSPVELLGFYLERIDRFNPRLNAFLTVTADLAAAAARKAEDEIAGGNYRGPLHGIPFALKDLIEVNGVRMTCGSKIFANYVSRQDATVMERLRAAGAILLGKLHLHEFAWGATSLNPHYGPARNPWDTECIVGGSSGGSAAAIAASMAPATLGTDTGGSVRIPASLCGVVGIKPTYGRVSRHGVFPLAASMDHVGPLARCVEDAAIVLKAIAGADARDRTTSRLPVPDYPAAIRGDIRGMRVGLLRPFFLENVEPVVRQKVEAAVAHLGALGTVVEEVSLPLTDHLPAASLALLAAESYAVHERHFHSRAHEYGADVRMRLMLGAIVPAERFLKAQQFRVLLYREAMKLFERNDVLVAPATPFVAGRIDQATVRIGDRNVVVNANVSRLTRMGNMTGLPALSLPCGFSDSGLPIGLQIIGRPFEEATILRVAHAYESSTEWHKAMPPL